MACNAIQTMSSSGPGPGPRSGPEGPRSKSLDLGYTLNFVCHHPPPTSKLFFLRQLMSPKHYYMISNHVPLLSAFKMTFKITFRLILWMTLRMTFKTWDFRGVRRTFKGILRGTSRGLQECV